jgi:protein tyrosine phosphatase
MISGGTCFLILLNTQNTDYFFHFRFLRRLCWEQNVHVIVMLTREVEGSMVKCGSYWVDDDTEDKERTRTYGPLTLRLVKKEGLPGGVDLLDEREKGYPQREMQQTGGGFFGATAPDHFAGPHAFGGHPHAAAFASSPNNMSTTPTRMGTTPTRMGSTSARMDATSTRMDTTPIPRRRKPPTTIKRTFELTHARYPHLGARRVVHLQYLEWPDMNVPDDARGVLGLIREVERGVEETWEGEAEAGSEESSPSDEGEKRWLYPPGSKATERAASSGETVTPAKVQKKKRDGDDIDGDKIDVDTIDHTDEGESRAGRSVSTGMGDAEVGRGEMAVDERNGIARHAMGGKERRPVLLHCSAGVGRTGGFIAVDAVLDAVRREMRRQKRVVKTEVGLGGERAGDAMDVDEPAPGMVTVPFSVGGAGAGGETGEEKARRGGGLVVHVPAIVVPAEGGGDDMRTPMQVDEGEGELGRSGNGLEERKEGGVSTTTRKWAETVLDETRAGAGGCFRFFMLSVSS